jgi:DNA-binding transcriptional ArsR family regulator
MGNDCLFKALCSSTRIEIMQILTKHEMHLSGLARKINISVPVVSRHIKILEEAGLVNKRIIGNVHLLNAKIRGLEKILEQFVEESSVEINKYDSLLDALNQLPGIEVKKFGGQQYIHSVDGEKGNYIYEVDGKLPNTPVDKYKPKKDVTLNLKKIVSINKKKVNIKVNNHKD